MLYIADIRTGEVTVRNTPHGPSVRATLKAADVGKVLSVLDGEYLTCSCDELTLEDTAGKPRFLATFWDGTKAEFGTPEAAVLSHALKQACLGICRTEA